MDFWLLIKVKVVANGNDKVMYFLYSNIRLSSISLTYSGWCCRWNILSSHRSAGVDREGL